MNDEQVFVVLLRLLAASIKACRDQWPCLLPRRCRVSSISLLATDSQTKEATTAELRGRVQFQQPGLVVVVDNPDGTSDVTFTREHLQSNP